MRRFSDRIKEHMTSVEKKDKTMGLHYTQPNHSKAYFRAQIIEKVSPCLLEREDYWIKKLDTKYHMASIFMTRITSRLYQFSFYSTNCSSFLFLQCRWTLIQFCMCRWTLKVCAYIQLIPTLSKPFNLILPQPFFLMLPWQMAILSIKRHS